VSCCGVHPGMSGPVMGPEEIAMVAARPGEEWLDCEKITALLKERDEARERKDWPIANDIHQRLKEANIVVTDKQKGHLWGSWEAEDGRCGQLGICKDDGLTDASCGADVQMQSRHVAFCHDSTQPWPAWVVEEGVHDIDLIVANPPWGKNIGKKEDGVAIVKSLVEHFSGSKCIMALLVSVQCFKQLASFDKREGIYAWHLMEDAFGVQDRVTKQTADCEAVEVERWSLIYHAEVGQSALMVMGWVHQRQMVGGCVYSQGYMNGYYNAPGASLTKQGYF